MSRCHLPRAVSSAEFALTRPQSSHCQLPLAGEIKSTAPSFLSVMPHPQGKNRREERWPSLDSLSKPLINCPRSCLPLALKILDCISVFHAFHYPTCIPSFQFVHPFHLQSTFLPSHLHSSIPSIPPVPTFPILPISHLTCISCAPSLLHPTLTSISPATLPFHPPICILFP